MLTLLSPCLSLRMALRTTTNTLRSTSLKMSTSSPPTKIINLTPKQLDEIFKSDLRSNYQIIDVRESDELQVASFAGNDIIHLPLSTASEWSTKIMNKELLDSTKPTICMCKLGGRSMKAATFFGRYLLIT